MIIHSLFGDGGGFTAGEGALKVAGTGGDDGGAKAVAALGIDGAGLDNRLSGIEGRRDCFQHALHGDGIGDDDLNNVRLFRDGEGGGLPLRKIRLGGAIPGSGKDAGGVVVAGPDAADDAEAEDADAGRS